MPARVDPADPAHDALDPVALLSAPAVRLFVDRAQQVQPAFRLTADNAEAVVEICARLDGLPLGIELAAARIPLLGAGGIRDRLVQRAGLPASAERDAPARQRTLREAIAWSHDLLDRPGRVLFAQMSVFVGGCRIKEAEAVCGSASELGAGVIDTLADLVDQSLVTATPADERVRYGMLETIREYAAEQLVGRDDRLEVQRRHALAYLALAEAAGPALRTRRRGAVAPGFSAEGDNLKAAVRWAIDAGDVEIGLRLAAALQNYWSLKGQVVEGRSATLAILDIPGADAPSPWRMRALEAAGALFFFSGDNDRAGALWGAELEVARALDDRQGTADACSTPCGRKTGASGQPRLTPGSTSSRRRHGTARHPSVTRRPAERRAVSLTFGRSAVGARTSPRKPAKLMLTPAIAKNSVGLLKTLPRTGPEVESGGARLG